MSELLVPSTRMKNGGGHIKRCVSILQKRERAFLYLERGEYCFTKEQLRTFIPKGLEKRFLWDEKDLDRSWEWILLDQRECSPSLWHRLKSLNRPLLALDEGGPQRNSMDYLIDAFPRLEKKHGANISSRSLLFTDTPLSSSIPKEQRKELLLSFGNEDPAGLSQKVLRLLERISYPLDKVTVVRGPLFSTQVFPAEVQILEAPEQLESLLPYYKRVICSFGLTAYEAERAGCSVLLVNPASYHQALTRRDKWDYLPLNCLSREAEIALSNFLENEGRHHSDFSGPTLPELLEDVQVHHRSCPCCPGEISPVIQRTALGNYHLCRKCGNYYLVSYLKEKTRYDASYFFEDYQKQYGKTYLEDFEHIYNVGRERIDRIMALSAVPPKKAVDLGCAYGPFLKAVSEKVTQVQGVELAGEAVEWVHEHLGVQVHHKSLLDSELDSYFTRNKVDLCTLWFVIEHFREQDALIQRCSRWLNPGGILAFSTPNGSGISARRNLERFLQESPADHYIIYKPKAVKKLLQKQGFKIKKIHITGHHPERILPGLKPGRCLFKIFMLISKCFHLGDTFEIYAEKR